MSKNMSNSNLNLEIPVKISTRVVISDDDTGEVLVDKSNAIHSQNMARVIARGLAKEQNHFIYRMAFGNGGTFRDAGDNLVYNPPNDGRDGSWESRLYNETYSEIVDETDVAYGTDPGSAESGNIRPGGGSVETDDPQDDSGGVISQEVGTKSNVIATVYLNKNEPTGQLEDQSAPGTVLDPDDRCFQFDELGLYSPGAPATATHGYATVNVNNATSETISLLNPNTTYSISIMVDGLTYSANLLTPAGGTGPASQFTYGDICEGINTGEWIASGDQINSVVQVYITDRTGGTYPSITGKQSYGYLTFESKSLGEDSEVVLNCSTGSSSNFFNAITNGSCANVDDSIRSTGKNAGVANDPTSPNNERERLLTHIIFDPILKTSHRQLKIVYILTVSVAKTSDSQIEVVNNSPPPIAQQ